MRKFYKWFDYFLNLSLVSTVISAGLVIYLDWQNTNFSLTDSYTIKIEVLTALLIVLFALGIVYVIVGSILMLVNRGKNVEIFKLAKRMLLKGIFTSIGVFIFYFVFSIALSFFGLSLGNCLCLPKIVDYDTPGFPVNDLVITDSKPVVPHESGDTWSCVVNVENNNPKSVANISFKDATNATAPGDLITFHGTTSIEVYPDVNSQQACKHLSITAAEFYNPPPSDQ